MNGSASRSKSHLPPGFIDHDRHGVGEVEAPITRHHRHSDALILGNRPKNLWRKPAALRTEDKGIARTIGHQIILLRAFGRDREETAIFEALGTIGPALINRDRREFVIVQPRSQ